MASDKGRRLLVCEGACNPDLPDYDQMMARLGQAAAKSITFKLTHTPHDIHSSTIWHPPEGWVHKWKCSVCGHVRRA